MSPLASQGAWVSVRGCTVTLCRNEEDKDRILQRGRMAIAVAGTSAPHLPQGCLPVHMDHVAICTGAASIDIVKVAFILYSNTTSRSITRLHEYDATLRLRRDTPPNIVF
jgi:hypothetical protein